MPFPNNCLNCDKPMFDFRLHDNMVCKACKERHGKRMMIAKKPTFVDKLNKILTNFRRGK